MEIYARLGFPEVWRFDGSAIEVHRLQSDGKYAIVDSSPNFPGLPMNELGKWLFRARTTGQNTLILEFSEWVRSVMTRREHS
jgi:Uma2 family endonuclease